LLNNFISQSKLKINNIITQMKINLLTLLLFSVTCTCLSAQTQLAVVDKASRFENKFDYSRPLSGDVSNLSTKRRYAKNANRPGVIQLGLGWGSVIGGATLTLKDSTGNTVEPGVGLTYNFGLRAQFGVTELISAGLYIRKDLGLYVTEFDDFDLNGFSVGFEGKVYFINKDMFTVYAAPIFGYSSASSNINSANPGKGSGLNYGLTAGLNWYWTDNFGMSCDLGYTGTSLDGKFDEADLKDLKYNIKYSGVFFGVGLVVKFGG
jgi:hypothetical protein